jgi:DNA polymerase-4
MIRQRKIIHVDMDAFFASVEQRDNPDYQGKPLIVGGQPNSRGVVAACSYEARKFGIHSAMPCATAYKLCPDAIFVPPRFEAYREISTIIRDIFWRYASDVEPLSLDEAYLDVTYTAEFEGSATRIAQAIKRDIFSQTNLIASAGVSYNKFLAKIASDMDKPDGLYLITPEQGADFVAQLAIGKFHGIGPATEKKMNALGIYTGLDLRAWSEQDLLQRFGKSGAYYYSIARGIDQRPVRSTRVRKSLGKETTFSTDVTEQNDLLASMEALAEIVFSRLDEQDLKPTSLTVKVKYANFEQVTRAITQDTVITIKTAKLLLPTLLAKTEAGQKAVRLVGVTAGSFIDSEATEQTQQLRFHLD